MTYQPDGHKDFLLDLIEGKESNKGQKYVIARGFLYLGSLLELLIWCYMRVNRHRKGLPWWLEHYPSPDDIYLGS